MVMAIITKYVCRSCGWKATKKTSDAIRHGDFFDKCPTCDAPRVWDANAKNEMTVGLNNSTVYFDNSDVP